jgi:hypothetical protein
MKKMKVFCEYSEKCLPLQGNKRRENMLKSRKTDNSGWSGDDIN